MAHLWEPLRVVPKPLAVPLFSEAGGALTRFLLRRQVGLTPVPQSLTEACARCIASKRVSSQPAGQKTDVLTRFLLQRQAPSQTSSGAPRTACPVLSSGRVSSGNCATCSILINSGTHAPSTVRLRLLCCGEGGHG
jgi:hypothetical protein